MGTRRTRDGRTIDMAEMSDAHLANAVEFQKRRLIHGLRQLDALEAEQRRREEEGPASRWRLSYAEDESRSSTATGAGNVIRIWVTPDNCGRIIVSGAGEEFAVTWWRGSAQGTIRGDNWPLMVRAAMAVDALCFGTGR